MLLLLPVPVPVLLPVLLIRSLWVEEETELVEGVEGVEVCS